MKLHYKITAWNYIEVPEEYKDELVKFLKSKPDAHPDEVYEWIDDTTGYAEDIRDQETEDFVTPDPDDDSYHATMELTENYDPIWTNTQHLKPCKT